MRHKGDCCAPQALEPHDPVLDREIVPVADRSRRPNLIAIDAGEFLMGGGPDEGYPADGEGPQRRVKLGAFSIAPHAVTNAEFESFVSKTGYVTGAERSGWSFVFHQHVTDEAKKLVKGVSSEGRWWLAVEDACWSRPEGPGSDVADRMDHPVTHVSWHDAQAFCQWSATRLPSEAEWEYAARGGLEGKTYPWGDELLPDGRHRCNIWQGTFPTRDLGSDGFGGTAPVETYAPNGYGLYNVAGNVWEWCEDWFSPNYHRVTRTEDPHYVIPTGRRSMRGGSFLCHHSYCNRYRLGARGSNTPDSTTNHCGVRIVGGSSTRDET